MFVSDTIHNAQYIHSLFFPMTMDLISLNTALVLYHNWFDRSFRYSYSSRCILYYCPQFSPNARLTHWNLCRQQRWPFSSNSWCYLIFHINQASCRAEMFKFCSKNRRNVSTWRASRSGVTAVQLLLGGGEPLPRCLASLTVESRELW